MGLGRIQEPLRPRGKGSETGLGPDGLRPFRIRNADAETDEMRSSRAGRQDTAHQDLIDIAVHRKLHFHTTSQKGVVFHLIGALSEFGKLGVVCVSDSIDSARDLYASTVRVLDDEAGQGR